MLTKLQSDIRSVEGDVLSDLVQNIDSGDLRVNKIAAQVIPRSQLVMQGSQYEASIVLSSYDSTRVPKIVVNGSTLPESARGRLPCHSVQGGHLPHFRIHRDGVARRHPLSSNLSSRSTTSPSLLPRSRLP